MEYITIGLTNEQMAQLVNVSDDSPITYIRKIILDSLKLKTPRGEKVVQEEDIKRESGRFGYIRRTKFGGAYIRRKCRQPKCFDEDD